VDRRLVLSDLRLEVCLEQSAVLGLEGHWRSHVKVVLEVGDMEHDGVPLHRHAKQLHGDLAAIQSAFFGLDGLEGEAVPRGDKIRHRRPVPCLILLCVVLLAF
jgi:hypothetical protein